MKVSIIIPLFNKAPYIRRALASIEAQTFTDYEVVVVDDGSSDDGPARAMELGGDRIRLIRQQNAGPGAARNRGISEAKGPLLAFLDADDEWLPDFLEESVSAFERYGTEIASVTTGYFEWPSGLSREVMWRKRGITDGVYRVSSFTPATQVVSMLAYMSPCSTVVRTEVVTRLGGFFDRDRCPYAEDAYLWLKVLLTERVAFKLKPLVRFHTEASGLSRNLKGARPVEPFLQRPEEHERLCPEDLQALLADVLAIRAIKTACVLGYWGDWQAARQIMRRFAVPRPWRLPRYFSGLVCSTPVGTFLGSAWRACHRRLGYAIARML